MFYSQFILAKKGPLGTIWIAAHLERKLRKNQVADTDIGVSVDSILFPDVPIALRLSSHLLLGVVRIYSRKVNYLFDDCSDTLLKIKQAFRSTAVDLPPEESTAPYHSITLPETFDLDDFELPDNDVFQGNYVDHHISSKEQITLQDTMDGVVYSTSQFGLDERFGDGDASQIGLDLEEDLFLDKLAAPKDEDTLNSGVDPQTSFQPITPFEEGEDDEEMNQTSPAMAAPDGEDQDCAEAPSTPGLVQEPNLCNVQKVLACDDHPQTEDLNPIALDGKKFDRTVVSNSDHHEYNEQVALDATPLEENGHDLDGEEIQHLKPKRDLPATSENLKHLENGVLIHNEANVDLSPSFSCEASQEDNSQKPSAVENMTTTLTVSERSQVEDQTVQTEVNNIEVSENVDQSCTPRNTLSPNALCFFEPAETEVIVEDQACHKPDEDGASPRVHVLQRCSSELNRAKTISLGVNSSVAPSDSTNDIDNPCSLDTSEMDEAIIASGMASEMQGEKCESIPAVILVPSVKEKLMPERNPSEDIETESRNLDAVLEDKSEFPNNSAISELPAPEKLLSMPVVPGNLVNEMLVGTTPDKMVSLEGEGDGTESRNKQGKKRSFSESTLTLQSYNADGSLANAQSNRTAGFIPDDDDLLSSILVGRKSSILKLKPTPTLTKVVPRKRPRITPRASASKRKVLMDESMVLHGDTIRQQLTSTEDIRRVRKKAPATRHEVWMIEKQFLEEEVFFEPISTGMTIDLIALHSEAYDLNSIKIIMNGNISAVDLTKNTEPTAGENVKKGKETGATETSFVRTDEEVQPAEIIVYDENQQGANSSIGLRDNEVRLQSDALSADIEVNISNNERWEITDMEIDGVCVDVANKAACTVSHGLEYPHLPVPVNVSLSVDKDASVLDLRNGEEINDVHFGEIPSDNNLECETESGARSEQLLKGTEDYEANDVRADSFTGSSQHTDNPELCITTALLDTGVCKDLILVNNHSIEETANVKSGFVKQQRDGATEFELDDKSTACDKMRCEDPKSGSLHLEESEVKNSSLDGAESTYLGVIERPGYIEAEVRGIMDLETSSLDHSCFEDQAGIGTTMGEHDTEFLNVDDDDIAEDDDYVPSAEEACHLENSGWSSRSRAVAKYLQTIFVKETELGKKVIPMDNLLSGKTRKEASRMFFETLVLKTRDYIHVEQPTPFNNINIKPRGKLMMLDF